MSRHPFAVDILCICLEHDEHVGQHVQYRDLELKVFSACLVAPRSEFGRVFFREFNGCANLRTVKFLILGNEGRKIEY